MKLYIPTTHKLLAYEGEEEHVFTAYKTRPFPVLSCGDMVMVEDRTAQWIEAKRMPFKKISPDDLFSVVTPSEEKKEGVISGIMSKALSLMSTSSNNVDEELLNRFMSTPNDLSLEELKRLCKLQGISGYSAMVKQELIDLLMIDINTPFDPTAE